MKNNIHDVIEQRLKLQSTRRNLEYKFGFPVNKDVNLMSLKSFYKKVPEDKKKDFLYLVGGKTNLINSQILFNS